MKKFFELSEIYFPLYLLFVSFCLAISTIFSKGSPSIFFSEIWLFIFAVSTVFLTIFAISKFIEKKYLKGVLSLLIIALVSLFFINTFSLKHEYIAIKDFNVSKTQLLEKNEVTLLEHGFGDTEKLRNYERAVFLFNGKAHVVELNKPLSIGNNRKILLTGDGKRILITKSNFLFEITIVVFTITLLMVLIMRKKWKQ